MYTPVPTKPEGNTARSVEMKYMGVKGKCLHCGRRTAKKEDILRYRYIKTGDYHILKCALCRTIVIAPTKEDVMRQIDGS